MDVNPHNQLNESSNMETKLWEYIDGVSQEPAIVEKLIAENREWKVKYAELMEVHQIMQGIELEEPSLRFTKNVMEQIAQLHIAPAAKKYINTKIIWGIAAFFISVIIGFLIYGLAQIDWSAADSTKTSSTIDVIANADYSKMFGNTFVNLFMMLNVVLGLLLLDRYLNMKRKKLVEKI